MCEIKCNFRNICNNFDTVQIKNQKINLLVLWGSSERF